MIDNLKKIVLNNKIFIFLAFFIFLKPLSVYYVDFLNKICNIIMFIFIALIGIVYIKEVLTTKKISKIQIYIGSYMVMLLISTIIGTKDFSFFFKVYVKWLAISIYVEMLIKNDLKKFLDTIRVYIFTITTLNFASIIIWPNGFIQPDGVSIYFLGNDNTSTINLVLGALLMIFGDYYKEKKMSVITIFDIVMVTASYLITWSATGIVAVVIMVAFIIFLYKKNKFYKIFNSKTYLAISIILFIIIVILRLQNCFEYIIVDILKKDLTFSQRVYIWDNCLNRIVGAPVLGLGVQEFSSRLHQIGIYHAHSTFLNVLLEGGFVGFALYLNIFIQTIMNLDEHKDTEYGNILAIGLFIYLICGVVEVFQDSQMLYVYIVLAYYIDKFVSEKKLKEKTNEEDISSN